jgi:diguanylate cyclase (GGDEF)-like protein
VARHHAGALRRAPSRKAFVEAAFFLAAGGLLCFVTALWPPSPLTNVPLSAASGAVLLVCAVLAVTVLPRLGRRGIEIALLALILGGTVTTHDAATELGHLSMPIILLAGIPAIAGLLPRRDTWGIVLIGLAAWSLAVATGELHHEIDGYLIALFGVAVPFSTHVCVRMVDRLSALALSDPLTGVLNRTGLELKATTAQSVAARAGQPTTLVAIDLDRFKHFNDQNGHPAGDQLLIDLTTSWQGHLRDADTVARTGGDEFIVVLPGTSPEEAAAIVERMSSASPTRWTAGAVEWRPGESLEEATARADAILYAAKQGSGGVPQPRDADVRDGSAASTSGTNAPTGGTDAA